jgi:hypothetical protein
MRSLVFVILFMSSKALSAQSYPFFAIANGGIIMSEKSGVVNFTDTAITVSADGSTEKPVVWKVTSHEGDVYKYNAGEFRISKESGKADGKKFNYLIYMTMPNGLGGTLTLKYVCMIKK